MKTLADDLKARFMYSEEWLDGKTRFYFRAYGNDEKGGIMKSLYDDFSNSNKFYAVRVSFEHFMGGHYLVEAK